MTEKLKKGWACVAFGDVVQRVTETRVPTSDESRTYIGLEHLNSDSFTVTRWGSDVDLAAPKLLALLEYPIADIFDQEIAERTLCDSMVRVQSRKDR